VLNIVVGTVVGMLDVIPLVGAIAGVFVTFHTVPIAGWLRDNGFAAAVDAAGDGDEVGTGPTVA